MNQGQPHCPSHPNAYCPKQSGEGECELCGHDFSLKPLDREQAQKTWQASRAKGEQVKHEKTEAELNGLKQRLEEAERVAEGLRQKTAEADEAQTVLQSSQTSLEAALQVA